MKRRTLVAALVIALVLCGCSKSEHDKTTADLDPRMELETPRLVASENTDARQESETSGSTKVRILLPNVVYEFGRRGGENCTVTRAESSLDGTFHFEWESPEDASWTAAEVIGVVMSALRGHDGYVGDLELVRTYAGGSRRISISHADYSEFASARINDDGFLEKCGLEGY